MAKAKRARAGQLEDRSSAHLRAIAAKFATQHPERARQERAFRVEQATLRKAHAKRDRLKDEGTPETRAKAARVSQGALARLFVAGAIDAHQLAWSAEIAAIHAKIGAAVAVGTASFETRVDVSRAPGGVFFERLGAVRAEIAYTAWRASLPRPGMVLAMICEDLSCSAAAKRYRMRKETARALLQAALDAWPDHQRDARDAVDEADLLAAQAGLL